VNTVLERLPALELFVNSRADTRRLHTRLAQARRGGIRIETVYDIGAHRGDWTRKVRASLADAQFILFEANDVHASSLDGERFYIGVLSSEPKLVQFHGNGGPGDSYFRETTGLYDDVTPVTVQTTTLDHLVREHGIPPPDFIKADVQGAELDVLRGGEVALANARLVLLECPIIEYNEAAPTLHEYFQFMDERGFTPIDVIEWHRRGARALQLDVLFGDIAGSN
jgi:FkbM family methyltransferase